jgi:two-component system response regulator LytT
METPPSTTQHPRSAYDLSAIAANEIAAPFHDPLAAHAPGVSKKSFLVFRYNKYVTVPTDTVAFFYLKYESCIMACFDRQEYSINYSLEQIQKFLSELQFFRLNRQFLINFNAIKEVEHYFSRRLLVNLVVPVSEKLLVSREKASSFFRWLEIR